jgi:hypothetical protein
MVNVTPVPPGEAGRRDQGVSIIGKDRPQDPVENTTWTNPTTGRDEVFSNGVWTEISQSTALISSNNLSDLPSASTARTNLGLGTMAVQNSDNVNLNGKIRISGIVAVSANYSVATTVSTVNATGGVSGITVTLPAANSSGQICIVRKVDSDAGFVTVSRAGTDNIEGVNTLDLELQYERCILQSDGAGTWYRCD